MKRKLLWIIAGILFAGFLFVQAIIRMQIENGFGLIGMGIELMANILLVVGLSAAIGALTAIIPNKKKEYKQKFRVTLPLSSIVVCGVLLYAFGHRVYLMNTGVIKNYSTIKTTTGFECQSLRNGKFITGTLYIDREGDTQVQWKENNSKKDLYKVSWVTDCEYHLTLMNHPEKVIKVKITEINKEGYHCYVSTGNNFMAEEYIIKYRID